VWIVVAAVWGGAWVDQSWRRGLFPNNFGQSCCCCCWWWWWWFTMIWCVDVLCGRWTAWSGTDVSTVRRNLRSRATLCGTFAFTHMTSRTNATTVTSRLPSRVRWQHTKKHIQVLKTSSVKFVRSYSQHRAASRSTCGFTLVSASLWCGLNIWPGIDMHFTDICSHTYISDYMPHMA